MRETEIAKPIVAWLERDGWDVYQEVLCMTGVADIVACLEKRIWIIETKTTLGLQVMAQAYDRLHHAHWVSVGVPRSKTRSSARTHARMILRQHGIGLIDVDPQCLIGNSHIEEVIAPTLNRSISPIHHWLKRLRRDLSEEQKESIAGSVSGGYWTPFKRTCRDVLRIVKKNPGIKLKELVESNDCFHYASSSSAKASLIMRIRQGIVPGVKLRQEGRYLKVYPK